jgi:hypothetical protein
VIEINAISQNINRVDIAKQLPFLMAGFEAVFIE